MGRQIDWQLDKYINGWVEDRQIDRQLDKNIDGWVDIDRQIAG